LSAGAARQFIPRRGDRPHVSGGQPAALASAEQQQAEAEEASPMAVYTAKAMLHGMGHDVWEMIVENIP
jgi:hypothetical protein